VSSDSWKQLAVTDLLITELKGLEYRVRDPLARRRLELELMFGCAVTIKRKLKNKFDKNACAVYLKRKHIGYIPREIAKIIAPKLDRGYQYKAFTLDFNTYFGGFERERTKLRILLVRSK
jgi:hypothetical protein